MAAKKAQGWRTAMPKRLGALQRQIEKRIRTGWEEVAEMLPPAPRKAMKRLTATVERTRHDLQKRGDRAVADMRKRAEHLTADLEKRLKHAMTPLTDRLDVASRAEVERLRKRLDQLERRVQTEAHSGVAA